MSCRTEAAVERNTARGRVTDGTFTIPEAAPRTSQIRTGIGYVPPSHSFPQTDSSACNWLKVICGLRGFRGQNFVCHRVRWLRSAGRVRGVRQIASHHQNQEPCGETRKHGRHPHRLGSSPPCSDDKPGLSTEPGAGAGGGRISQPRIQLQPRRTPAKPRTTTSQRVLRSTD
jgi:hypothetical protein